MDFLDSLQTNAELIVWSIIILLSVGVEMATVALVSIWFVCGGIVALIIAWYGGSLLMQLTGFVVTATITFLLARPLFIVTRATKENTNVDKMVGSNGIVITEIDNLRETGRVRADSLEWSARSISGSNIPANTAVVIHRIEGVTLFVSPVDNM